MQNAIIELQHITKVFELGKDSKVTAVDDVSLTVEKEEFVCIVGPSGCGKSTLLYLIAALDQPTSGNILVEGQPVNNPNPRVGMVFQPDSVFPWLSVQKNVEFGPSIRNLPAGEVERIAKE
ncbi:MAG: ATP-binding cassette domain-containing protein, partial [Anaerolineaceae bacterium]|nr:ATP-binding cassette domain-containing protein [Anaerolineaceae bacterium]